MKPKNFPERKRQRQLAALVRFPGNRPKIKGERDAAQMIAERKTLVRLTVTSLRDVRSKKQLATGSAARQARQGGKLGRATR